MSTASLPRKEHCSHHFNSQHHEHETCKQGLWLFMISEIMMFGGLFVAYAIYRAKFGAAWVEGGELLDWRLGALNTIVLLLSSWTMALAVRDTQMGNNKKALMKIAITTVCALAFMIVKYFEYSGKIHHGLFPGLGLWAYEAQTEQLRLFMTIYFMMTGLHGLHILVGIGLMIWLMKRLKNEEFGKDYFITVEGVGLYWHIVDVIWIYLFPLMYLM
jgi:cytochrome c oxidase subunit 3